MHTQPSSSPHHLELEHPQLDEGVLLRPDPLAGGAVVIRAHLAVQHAVDVRPLAELNLVVGLATTKQCKKKKPINDRETEKREREAR